MNLSPLLVRLGACIAATLAATFLSGCGNLKVTMQVLNPEVVQRELDKELVNQLLPIVITSTPDSITADVLKLKEMHRDAYTSLSSTYKQQADKLTNPLKATLGTIADDLVGDFPVHKDPFYASLTNDLTTYRKSIADAMQGKVELATSDVHYATVLRQLRLWQLRVAQASAVIGRDIRKKVADAQTKLRTALGPALVVPDPMLTAGDRSASVLSQLAQLSIQNSPMAFVVANADDRLWAERYNHVLTSSTGGASDVAIKLDPDTGNYLLKGLSFDPADVAAMAAKVTTQALLVATQIAGVPVKQASAPADGTAGKGLVVASGALADAQAATEARRAQDEARKAALIALANVILSEEADLAGNDAQRKAAVAAIRSAFVNRQTLIRSTNP